MTKFFCRIPDIEEEWTPVDEHYSYSYAAEMYAAQVFKDGDGWEWMHEQDAIVEVRHKDGVIKTYSVITEFEPCFWATEKSS